MKAMTSPMPTIGRVNNPPLFMYAKNRYPQADNLEVGKHYAVYVSQIYSVHHFYIQRRGTNASVRLEALMNKLESVYKGPQSCDYLVDDKLVYVGMPCAAPYTDLEGNSDWHRALVVSLDPDPRICQVLFVDYGTLNVLPRTELRFLRNDFLDLPPQAVLATMEYLKPVTSEGWTREAKAAFVKLVSGDKTLVCSVLKRRGALHSVNLCITSWQPEAYVSDLLVKKGLALPTLRHKRIMAQLMEGEPFSTDLQGDDGISNEPPSANGDCDTSARLPAIAEHPSHYPFRADHNLQGDLMPQPAHLILRAHSSQPTDQAKPLYHTQPGDQTIAFNSQTIKHVRALDRGCAHAPAINLAEKMQGIPFAQQVQLTVPQPVTCGTRRPTPQYPEEVPRKFVTLWVHKNRAQEKAALFQQLGIAPPKDWEKLAAKEDARLARTESTAETTMQPTLQAAPHLSGEPADMSFQCFNGTSTVLPCPQSAVQDAAQSGGEPSVQPIASPAVQRSFEPLVQPTLEPAMLGFSMVSPDHLDALQEPQSSGGTSVKSAAEAPPSREPACEADDDEDIMCVLRRELDGPCPARAVKPVYLKSGYCLMILNYEQLPYVTAANVSQFLGWSSDVTLQKLEDKCIQFPTLVLKKEDHLSLFNQMASYEVPGVKIHQQLARQVTLFPLKNVVDLLNLFECTVKNLREEVVVALRAFDPANPYWLVSSSVSYTSTQDQLAHCLVDESFGEIVSRFVPGMGRVHRDPDDFDLAGESIVFSEFDYVYVDHLLVVYVVFLECFGPGLSLFAVILRVHVLWDWVDSEATEDVSGPFGPQLGTHDGCRPRNADRRDPRNIAGWVVATQRGKKATLNNARLPAVRSSPANPAQIIKKVNANFAKTARMPHVPRGECKVIVRPRGGLLVGKIMMPGSCRRLRLESTIKLLQETVKQQTGDYETAEGADCKIHFATARKPIRYAMECGNGAADGIVHPAGDAGHAPPPPSPQFVETRQDPCQKKTRRSSVTSRTRTNT
ncbi:uncharacterized protein LOC119445540 [Dermacentor silvarum]|uniref:uncharacterized protein LOC119445540 n=1 Tax=Dermacentor silvarum TaxID=543639 RepID=UPI002100BA51|nr:uncharacterized protein LOC119445540 [Dermacentor silvarum]